MVKITSIVCNCVKLEYCNLSFNKVTKSGLKEAE